jgi:hypothetical protein
MIDEFTVVHHFNEHGKFVIVTEDEVRDQLRRDFARRLPIGETLLDLDELILEEFAKTVIEANRTLLEFYEKNLG